MLRFCLLFALCLCGPLTLAPAQAAEAEISGPLRVIDADTVDVAGQRIRLHAIDAPEVDQSCETEHGQPWAECGAWVSHVVAQEFGGVDATCTPLDRDAYGRVVARCFVEGADLGATLVSRGLAFAYVKYGDDYVAHQARAAAADRGLHAVRVTQPSWHRQTRAAGRLPLDPACNIKGNSSANGKIYHVPGQAFYERTGIRTERGERWFCSSAEAGQAGWRPARR